VAVEGVHGDQGNPVAVSADPVQGAPVDLDRRFPFPDVGGADHLVDVAGEPGAVQDPLTYVYDLRQGVKFHDGATMTSEDVAYSFSRHVDPKVGSYWGSLFGNVASIKVTGAHQVTMKLKRPDNVINQLMAVIPGVIESKAFLTGKGKAYGSPQGSVDCTGPFKVDSWSKGQSITLSRFDGYWDTARAAKVDKLTFNFIQGPATPRRSRRSRRRRTTPVTPRPRSRQPPRPLPGQRHRPTRQ